jgi:hypothetical protein
MSSKHDEHDKHQDALEKVLAALRDADPPEAMEARITHRLQQHATAPPAAPFRWRDIVANSAPTAAWWRGAITGAAAVLLVTATFLLAGHLLQTYPDRATTATNGAANRNIAPDATLVNDSPHGAPGGETRAQPCAHPAIMRTASVVPIYTSDALRAETRVESDAPSHPAPPLPLTDQERALIRLVQTASPRQLAVINPEEYANLEAQSALKFERFFAPPAPLPAVEANAPANSIETPEANSEDKPEIVEEYPSLMKEEE